MLTVEYLNSQPDKCNEFKSPPAVGQSGFYPTKSCIRYDAATEEYMVSIEEFMFREASDPEPPVKLSSNAN